MSPPEKAPVSSERELLVISPNGELFQALLYYIRLASFGGKYSIAFVYGKNAAAMPKGVVFLRTRHGISLYPDTSIIAKHPLTIRKNARIPHAVDIFPNRKLGVIIP